MEDWLTRKNFRRLIYGYVATLFCVVGLELAWPDTGLSENLIAHNQANVDAAFTPIELVAGVVSLAVWAYALVGLARFQNHCRYVFLFFVLASAWIGLLSDIYVDTYILLIGNYYHAVFDGVILLATFLPPVNRYFKADEPPTVSG